MGWAEEADVSEAGAFSCELRLRAKTFAALSFFDGVVEVNILIRPQQSVFVAKTPF